jgi:hypothetical protein
MPDATLLSSQVREGRECVEEGWRRHQVPHLFVRTLSLTQILSDKALG